MNYREWKYQNFFRLLRIYHLSGLSFTDWEQYCVQQFTEENREVALS